MEADRSSAGVKSQREMRPRLEPIVFRASEFDQPCENAYFGAPFSASGSGRMHGKDRSRLGGIAVPQGGLLNYGANAGCDVEADAGFPARKHRQRKHFRGSP